MYILAAVLLPLILQAWVFSSAVLSKRRWVPALFGLYPLAVVSLLSALLDTDPIWPLLPVLAIAFIHTGWLRGGSWEHERKDGGPDRRFRSNRYILNSPEPVRAAALAAALSATAGAGLSWLVMTEVRALKQKAAAPAGVVAAEPAVRPPDMAQETPDLAQPAKRKRLRRARRAASEQDAE